jgi:hypothetical protein
MASTTTAQTKVEGAGADIDDPPRNSGERADDDGAQEDTKEGPNLGKVKLVVITVALMMGTFLVALDTNILGAHHTANTKPARAALTDAPQPRPSLRSRPNSAA